MIRLPVRIALCTVALFAALASPALAAPNCAPSVPAATPLFSGGGILESVIVDNQGRLYFTDSTAGQLRRIDYPGGQAYTIASGLANPGGLALDGDGQHIFVGVGNGFAGGLLGNLIPQAKIMRLNTANGSYVQFATGLRMANGLARAADGTMYASSDVGTSIDKISPTGVVTNNWANVLSGNGLVIDPGNKFLFVNQTFVPASITRIPLGNPGAAQTYMRAGLLDIAAGLDGLTMDPRGRLVAAANSGLSIWRVSSASSYCVIGRNLLLPSAVAYGRGNTGFSAGHLYAVTFTGGVFEIPGGYVAP